MKRNRPKPPCPYGDDCSMQRAAHQEAFAHGEEEALGPDEVLDLLTKRQTQCRFGTRCNRKNKLHFFEEEHPMFLRTDPFPNPRHAPPEAVAAAPAAAASSSSAAPAAPAAAAAPEPAKVEGSGVPGLVSVFDLMEADKYGGGGQPLLMPRTVHDRRVDGLRHEICHKPSWWTKVRDEEIVAKWRAEAGDAAAHLDRAVAELRHELDKAAKAGYAPPLVPAPVPMIWQGDGLLPEEVRQRLVAGFEALEGVPDSQKDWHPGSDEQVLDLVHPSLYPLVAGRTVVLDEPVVGADEASLHLGEDPAAVAAAAAAAAAAGDDDNDDAKMEDAAGPPTARVSLAEVESRLAAAREAINKRMYGRQRQTRSVRYQWLPAEFEVSADGAAVRVASYINNLHPGTHAPLYQALRDAFRQAALPLFERTIDSLVQPEMRPPRCEYDMYSLYPDPTTEEEEDDDYYENRQPKVPPLLPFDAEAAARGAAQPVRLRGRNLQVIVKMATVVLTPEKPAFPGGVWHCEGFRNESIVATALLYVENENITESRLAFRAMRADPPYEQSDERGVEAVFGIGNEEVMNDPLGHIVAQTGRAVAFPNVYQHRVAPFGLADPARPGHRRFVAFFLCDPNKKVVSTARVPPQQPDWTARMLAGQQLLPYVSSADVRRIIAEYAAPATHEQALRDREALMEERKYYFDAEADESFEREFSLCEH